MPGTSRYAGLKDKCLRLPESWAKPVHLSLAARQDSLRQNLGTLNRLRVCYEPDEAHPDPSGKPGLCKEPLHGRSHAANAFPTAAVMIREPERKKEREKRKPSSRMSPWS